jgi:peroxiredoxin
VLILEISSPLAFVFALVMCLAAVLTAQETSEAQQLLEESARKYHEIGSYQSHAIARQPLGEGLTCKVDLTFAYAAPRMTPSDLPVPMLPQAIKSGFLGVFDQQDRPTTVSRSCAGPGPAFSFDQIAWRVTSAKISGTETVHAHVCEIVEVQYEGARRNPNGEPVRYWIERATKTIWKMQFSESDILSKTGDLAHWTVVWNSWNEDQAPPDWQVDLARNTIAKEQTALIGQEAPEVSGRTLRGEPFQLSKLKGSVVVLDFWVTWCGPCAEEMASLERLKSSLSGKTVEIWSISEETSEIATRWLAERKRTLPTAFVPRDTSFRAYRIDALPQIVMIDRRGTVAHHWVGLKNENDLRQAIEVLLAQ